MPVTGCSSDIGRVRLWLIILVQWSDFNIQFPAGLISPWSSRFALILDHWWVRYAVSPAGRQWQRGSRLHFVGMAVAWLTFPPHGRVRLWLLILDHEVVNQASTCRTFPQSFIYSFLSVLMIEEITVRQVPAAYLFLCSGFTKQRLLSQSLRDPEHEKEIISRRLPAVTTTLAAWPSLIISYYLSLISGWLPPNVGELQPVWPWESRFACGGVLLPVSSSPLFIISYFFFIYSYIYSGRWCGDDEIYRQ